MTNNLIFIVRLMYGIDEINYVLHTSGKKIGRLQLFFKYKFENQS